MSNRKLIFFVNILALLGWISVNIYLPSLPHLKNVFHTDAVALKLSITLFLIAFSLSQFFWGSLSERVGRYPCLLMGLCIANFGAMLAMIAWNIYIFNTARLIEGLGIGAAGVLGRALLTDKLNRQQISGAMSIITTTANIIPALAPMIGGYLQLLSWRFIFLFLMIYTSFVTYVLIKHIPETHPHIKKDFRFKHALKQYLEIFTHRKFLGYLIPYICLSSGTISFYAAAPFVFITQLNIAPQHYSYYSIVTVASYIAGATLSTIGSKRLGFKRAIILGILMSSLAALFYLVFFLLKIFSPLAIIFSMMFYTFAAGFVSPNANACAMTEVASSGGASAAVIGSMMYLGASILSFILNLMPLNQTASFAVFYGSLTLIATASFFRLAVRAVKC